MEVNWLIENPGLWNKKRRIKSRKINPQNRNFQACIGRDETECPVKVGRLGHSEKMASRKLPIYFFITFNVGFQVLVCNVTKI